MRACTCVTVVVDPFNVFQRLIISNSLRFIKFVVYTRILVFFFLLNLTLRETFKLNFESHFLQNITFRWCTNKNKMFNVFDISSRTTWRRLATIGHTRIRVNVSSAPLPAMTNYTKTIIIAIQIAFRQRF